MPPTCQCLPPYEPASTRGVSLRLLDVELLHATLAGIAAVVLTAGYGFATSPRREDGRPVAAVLAVTACTVIVLLVVIFNILIGGLLGGFPVGALLLVVVVWGISLVGAAIAGVPDEGRAVPLVAGVGAAAAVVLPFLLWTAIGLRYDVARAAAVVLAVGAIATGPIVLARRLRARTALGPSASG